MPLDTSGSVSGYGRERNDLQYRYNTDRAMNAYGRFLSQQRGTRDLGDLYRNYQRALPTYRSTFTQRGLAGPGINSGTMQRAMGMYAGDYARDYGRTQQDITQNLQNYDLQAAQLDAAYNNAGLDIEQRKQNNIANAARAITALRPYLGGI
jgi:hypothetical protein